MNRQLTDREKLQAILVRCAEDRIFFIEQILEATPDPWQREELEALDRGETRVSVRSGHGVGKTCFCAWLALHFLLFRRNCKVVITSPSSRQMDDGLKPEVKMWVDRLPRGMGLYESLEVTSDRITKTDGSFISFRTARLETPEALAGIHAESVLAIVDEASGVPEPVYEAAAGTMSSAGAIFVLIGNPTKARGFFYRTHTTMSDYWHTRKVSCLTSPRVDVAFIEDIKRAYGVDSNQFRVRVEGEFPTFDADAVIPMELADSALGRDVDILPESEVYWGIDPGRGGDPTGFCIRKGNHVLAIEPWHYADLMRIVGKVKLLWDETNPSERPTGIYVDAIGLGAGVADRLRELDLPVVDVNVAEAPSMADRYPRLRAELWFNTRDWLESRDVCIPKHLKYGESLIEELTAPEMKLLSNGKTDVESKDDMKRRGIPSPNLADALNLTMAAYGGAVQAGRGMPKKSWKKPLRSRYVGVA